MPHFSLPRLFLLLGACSLSANTYAATFDTRHAEQHQHWQSLVLTLGEERHFRAVETHSYADATLSVNTTQGVCDLPWLEMRVELDQRQQASRAVNLVPTRLRVDEATRHEGMAEFITERGDNGFYVHFYLNELDDLLDEMHSGETIYLGFDQEEREPWYMTFSLEGAAMAIERMQAQCASSASSATGQGRENR
ncbi:hypothetical protein R5M92_00665 [Halomonas sp. Bachu 37]|uniref:hypothetical protein n=1 Tax=Halomonas kashgarensis TaxID=3084920 RepID=UPI0032167A0E